MAVLLLGGRSSGSCRVLPRAEGDEGVVGVDGWKVEPVAGIICRPLRPTACPVTPEAAGNNSQPLSLRPQTQIAAHNYFFVSTAF